MVGFSLVRTASVAIALSAVLAFGCSGSDPEPEIRGTGGEGGSGGTGGIGGTGGSGGAGGSATELIGPEGGVVTGEQGITVTIPAGALASETTIMANVVEASGLPARPSGMTAAGPFVALTPHGTQFAIPVEVALPYTSTSSSLSVLRIDDENDTTWEQLTRASFEEGAATVDLSRFSILAVAAPDTGGTGGTSGSGGSGGTGGTGGAPTSALAVYDGGSGDDFGWDITIDDAGRILVVGDSLSASSVDMMIWRYDATGELDPTFGVGGIVRYDRPEVEARFEVGYGLTLDAAGKILVTGQIRKESLIEDMAIWRYDANGTLDTTFGVDGIATYDGSLGGGNNYALGLDVAVDAAGKIVVLGESGVDGGVRQDMTIWRYDADGTLDTTFGVGGIVVDDNAEPGENGLTIDSAGRILVAGYRLNASFDNDMVIWRYDADGTLDPTFGVGGIVVYDGPAEGSEDFGSAVTIDAAGRILVAGYTTSENDDGDLALWRYDATGELDPTFGVAGIVVYPLVGSEGLDVVVDAAGKILVTGDSDNASSNLDMTIWRYNANGTLDPTFGVGGIVVDDNAAGGNGYDTGWALTVDAAAGKILVAGDSLNARGDSDMVIWRYE